MDALLHAAEAVLRLSPLPALALSYLTEEVRATTGERALEPGGLLDALRRYPDRFKILDPGRGPWRFVARRSGEGPDEPWVVSLHDPESPSDGHLADRLQRLLRESLRSVARVVDPDSPLDVIRWHAMAVAGETVTQLLKQRAA